MENQVKIEERDGENTLTTQQQLPFQHFNCISLTRDNDGCVKISGGQLVAWGPHVAVVLNQ